MNRADKAPEPSMEDILASIRRIISDDDSHMAEAGLPGEAPLRFHDAPLFETERNSASSAPSIDVQAEEDVLDLTDELVFADRQENRAAPEPVEEASRAHPERGWKEPVESKASAGDGRESVKTPDNRASPGPAANGASRAQPQSKAHAAPDWSRPSLPGPRPVWSRRDLPQSDGAFQPLAARVPPSKDPRQDMKPREKKTASRPWSEDIQMPVPDHGPVPLLSQSEQRQARKDPDSGSRPIAGGADEENPDTSKAEAVAALAQTLAKSAIVSLDDDELAHAQNVDFEHLGEDRKSDVAQSFADAISSNRLDGPSSALFLQPGLLDQMLRQDFTRPAFHDANGEEDDMAPPPFTASGSPYEDEMHFSSVANCQRQPEKGLVKDMTVSHGLNSRPVSQAVASAQRQSETLPASVSVAQAQPQTCAPSAGKGLEDVVREMLRPLLTDWLNENMPRILESAIREEIAVRGLPKLDVTG